MLQSIRKEPDNPAVFHITKGSYRYFLDLFIRVIQTIDQGQDRAGIALPPKGHYGKDSIFSVGVFQIGDQFSDQGLGVIQKGSDYT